MSAIITLTTDFGLVDAYVAAMKGVVLGINPEAKLVDICHSIQPQNVAQAAFVLSTACEFFPRRTIHLVVVDPSVGTERSAIILRTPEADFVAPDNGVLSYIIQRYTTSPADSNRQLLEPGAGLEAIAITRPQFWRSTVSTTFHGRDIFAPVAAHLSRDVPPADFGEAVDSLTVFPIPRPHPAPDGTLVGHILHIDSFGNLITSIKRSDLQPVLQGRAALMIKVGSETISGLSRTYGDGQGLMALMGSSGYLEVSLKEGDASAFLKAEVGDEIRIKRAS
jgi:S-adenosylmethionine hydrolase